MDIYVPNLSVDKYNFQLQLFFLLVKLETFWTFFAPHSCRNYKHWIIHIIVEELYNHVCIFWKLSGYQDSIIISDIITILVHVTRSKSFLVPFLIILNPLVAFFRASLNSSKAFEKLPWFMAVKAMEIITKCIFLFFEVLNYYRCKCSYWLIAMVP